MHHDTARTTMSDPLRESLQFGGPSSLSLVAAMPWLFPMRFSLQGPLGIVEPLDFPEFPAQPVPP